MINVLVVDDSAVVREGFAQLAAVHRGVVVTTARDPIVAFERMKRQRPDVIVLDLDMPRMNGLTFLRKVMAEDPIPVVVCSGLATAGTPLALEAVAEGAVEIIEKPPFGVRDFLQGAATQLLHTIRGAARARIVLPHARTAESAIAAMAFERSAVDIVAIGASTGGPTAVREILEVLPADAPPVVVVQHMARVFTAPFAKWLNEACKIEVREAVSGDVLRRGTALVAPGDHHMRVVTAPGGLQVRLDREPANTRHRPSVDVLFHSIAEMAATRSVGILLTGMGADGANGLLAMRKTGGFTIAQDEATSVVFGMPREAITRGAAASVLPLQEIAAAIARA